MGPSLVRVPIPDRTVVKIVIGLVFERGPARYVLASGQQTGPIKVTVHDSAPWLTSGFVN